MTDFGTSPLTMPRLEGADSVECTPQELHARHHRNTQNFLGDVLKAADQKAAAAKRHTALVSTFGFPVVPTAVRYG